MLVTFSSDAYPEFTMFGDVAIRLIKMMGHSGTVPSAILAEDIPAALARLQAALQGRDKGRLQCDVGQQRIGRHSEHIGSGSRQSVRQAACLHRSRFNPAAAITPADHPH